MRPGDRRACRRMGGPGLPRSAGVGLSAERRHRPLIRLDFHLCPHLLDRAHDHQVVRLDLSFHHAEPVFLQGPRLDAAGLGLVLRIEDVNVLQPLIGLDRPIDDQQGLVRLADRQPDPHEHARRKLVGNTRSLAGGDRCGSGERGAGSGEQDVFSDSLLPALCSLLNNQRGVRECAAHRDAARRRIYLVVDEVDHSLVREALLVLQPQQDRKASLRRRHDLLRFDQVEDPQPGRFIHVEIDVHRVQRYDCGQECLVLVDQIAAGQVIAAHLAVDGRYDVRELLV